LWRIFFVERLQLLRLTIFFYKIINLSIWYNTLFKWIVLLNQNFEILYIPVFDIYVSNNTAFKFFDSAVDFSKILLVTSIRCAICQFLMNIWLIN